MNKFEILDSKTVKLVITGNKIDGEVLISREDLERVSSRQWYIKDSTNENHYVACKMNGKTCKLHRFILNAMSRTDIVDHINRNTLDNRRENLRIVSSTENNLNCRKSRNNSSGRTGVYFKKAQGNRSDLFIAQWNVNDRHFCKCFSIRDLGYEEAFKQASEYRAMKERELNILSEK